MFEYQYTAEGYPDPGRLYFGSAVFNMGDYRPGFASVASLTGVPAQILQRYKDGTLALSSIWAEALSGADTIDGNRYGNLLRGYASADVINGGDGDDHLYGDAGADTLSGGDGDDHLHDGSEADTLHGGKGNDTFYVRTIVDRVRDKAGEGQDTVIASGSFKLANIADADIEVLKTSNAAATAAINLTGNTYDQSISGNAGKNLIKGGGGKDTIVGGNGQDTHAGDGGRDLLSGYKAGSTAGDGDRDTFRFNLITDSTTSSSSRDQLWGNFSGKAAYDSGGKADLIDLSRIDTNGKAQGGDGIFQWEGSGSFDSAGGEVRVVRQGSTRDYLVSIDTDSDTAAEMTFLVHATSAGLGKGDFLL